MNAFGGEDRLWLGPEGGQFSIFFEKGDPFDLAHWYTPAAVDTEPYPVTSRETDRVTFEKKMRLTNRAGTVFDLALRNGARTRTLYGQAPAAASHQLSCMRSIWMTCVCSWPASLSA